MFKRRQEVTDNEGARNGRIGLRLTVAQRSRAVGTRMQRPPRRSQADRGLIEMLDAELLHDSFALVAEREPQLTGRFYEILFERYPQARPLFQRNAPEQQQKMLQEALVAVLDHLEDAPWLTSTLGALGAKHAEYGVTEQMYDWVGECLLATLEEIAAEDWSKEMASEWGDAYGAIQEMMLAGAGESGSPAGRPTWKSRLARMFGRGAR